MVAFNLGFDTVKLHRFTWAPAGATATGSCRAWVSSGPTRVYRRNLNLKAKLESSSSYSHFKRLVPGAFNVGLIGAAAPPYQGSA